MRVKWSQIYAAMDTMRREAGLDNIKDSDINITMREEDPGGGVIGDCIILTTAVVKKAASYEDIKSDKTIEYTIEVWPYSENRPPRFVAVETRDIITAKG